MTVKQFFDGISRPRNVTLMRIFLSMGLTEHTGHGVPTIIEKYGKDVFEIDDSYIKCVIPYDKDVVTHLNKNVGLNVGLNNTERRVLELLAGNSKLTSVDLSEKINVTKRTVERAFLSLQKKDLLKREGTKRDGKWIVLIKTGNQ